MPNLTKRTVDAAKPKAEDYLLWDDTIPGFGLRVYPTGRRLYLIQYRTPAGRTRRLKIGPHGAITPEQARKRAKELLGQVHQGGDPAETKRRERRAGTVRELCDRYFAEATSHKKETTLYTDRGRIKRHVLPLIGNRAVTSIRKADIQRLLVEIASGKTATDVKTKKRGRAIVRGGKGAATRTIGLLGAIFQFAVDQGLIDHNPVRGVSRYADKRMQRFLSAEEISRLGHAIQTAALAGAHPSGILAIRLLLLTGLRRSEVMNLRWSEVDWPRKQLNLGDSKTGARIVHLGDTALDVLRAAREFDCGTFVFSGTDGERPYGGLPKLWDKIRQLAELDDVRLHDLRHTFASVSAEAGYSLLMISRLLGHGDTSSASRYAHLAENPVQSAANAVSSAIASALLSNDREAT